MRAVAISVWVFINLGFLGMCGYIYLIFSQYWYHAAKQTHAQSLIHKRTSFNRDNQVVFYEPMSRNTNNNHNHNNNNDDERGSRNKNTKKQEVKNAVINKRSHPRNKPASRKTCDENLPNCTYFIPKDEKKLNSFKNDLFVQMRRVLHEESSVFKTDNPYYVNYNGPRSKYQNYSPDELRCLLKKTGIRTLNRKDPPFSKLEFGNILGEKELFYGRRFDSCAIVSNAASLLNSRLGSLIDNHDVVVRFNHAPTDNYEDDVGTKTSVRIVNSQVVTKDEFQFTTNFLYKNVTIIVWDPSNYSASLQQWYEKPDFDFFGSWARHKLSSPDLESFILDPRSVWRIWDYIQSLTPLRIRRNPPSSGFLGIALMLPHCNYVDVFEYIPSVRLTKKCHYFDEYEDSSCTFGVWHPLAAEKMITLAMNKLNDTTVFHTGFIRIRGYFNLSC